MPAPHQIDDPKVVALVPQRKAMSARVKAFIAFVSEHSTSLLDDFLEKIQVGRVNHL
jgi:hypothetical protein